jgi:glycogen operon protein
MRQDYGFTLNDLVSYNLKHNEANGEGNRDGADDNRSWNCGVEGPTDDAAVESLRNRQIKNFLTCTMLSLGMPMMLMGDEVRRSQQGNKNAYCQDNETSWFDWTLISKHADMHRFVRLLIARRLMRDVQPEYQRESLNQVSPGIEQSLARRKTVPTRLEQLVAQHCVQRRVKEG